MQKSLYQVVENQRQRHAVQNKPGDRDESIGPTSAKEAGNREPDSTREHQGEDFERQMKQTEYPRGGSYEQ